MKTNIQNIAAIISTAIWADGTYDPAEKVTVEEIAEALELDLDAFKAEVEKQLQKVEALSEEEANAFLLDAAQGVDDDEIGIVFEAAMQMLLCDGVLSRDEVTNLLAIADALGIAAEDAILLLADMVKEEPELEIDFED